jgi:hypothetical protein
MMMRPSAALLFMIVLGWPQRSFAQLSGAVDARLENRVTISFHNMAADRAIDALIKAGGLKGLASPQGLSKVPVTLTLTNARLRTAFDAVCDNALCQWHLDTANGIVVIHWPDATLPPIPTRVSLVMTGTPLPVAFAAVAAALNVALILDMQLPERSANFNLESADRAGTLKLMCDLANCAFALDESARTLRISAR